MSIVTLNKLKRFYNKLKIIWDSLDDRLEETEAEVTNLSEVVTNNYDNSYKLSGGISINPNTNLNDLKDIGNYYCKANVDAATLINSPTNGKAFTMKIIDATGLEPDNFYRKQIIDTYLSDHYERVYLKDPMIDEWTSWKKIIDEEDIEKMREGYFTGHVPMDSTIELDFSNLETDYSHTREIIIVYTTHFANNMCGEYRAINSFQYGLVKVSHNGLGADWNQARFTIDENNPYKLSFQNVLTYTAVLYRVHIL